jgi:hypothetical protein
MPPFPTETCLCLLEIKTMCLSEVNNKTSLKKDFALVYARAPLGHHPIRRAPKSDMGHGMELDRHQRLGQQIN